MSTEKHSSTGNILIVDDSPANLQLLADTLASQGYTAYLATTGEFALQSVQLTLPDLILLDVLLPTLDGYQVCARLKADDRTRAIPVIFLTVSDNTPDKVKGFQSGAVDYITKPFEPAEVLARVATHLRIQNLTRQLQEANSDLERRVAERTQALYTANQQLQAEIAERKRVEEDLRIHHLELGMQNEELRSVQQDLTASHQKYADLYDFAPLGYCTIDQDGCIVEANLTAATLFGVARKRFITMRLYQFIIKEDRDVFFLHLRQLAQTKTRQTCELRLVKPDGTQFWAQLNTIIAEDKRYRTAITDFTERKQAEEGLRKSRRQLRELTTRMAESEETERQRFARELHDRVGQNLTALSITLSIFQSQLPPALTAQMSARLDDAQNLIEETIAVIRNIMAELRPAVLDDYGLLAALRWYGEVFAKRTGIPVRVQGAEDFPRFPTLIETALFRISQEALTNVAKYAKATQVTISLDKDSAKIVFAIVDDGVGIDPAVPQRATWGLLAMRERAFAIGGRLDIVSAPGRGTKIFVELECL